MNKIIKTIFLMIAAIAILTAPVLGAITGDDALKIADKYSKSSENIDIYGPYTLQNKSYYYTEYSIGNTLTGTIVIDIDTGEVVSDEKTLRQIFFTVYYLMNVSNEAVAVSNLTAQQYRAAALLNEQQAETMKNVRPHMKEPDWERVKSTEQDYRNIAALFNKIAAAHEEIAIIEMDVLNNSNMSYENAMKLSQLFKDMEEDFKSLDSAYDDISKDMNAYYDIMIESPGYYQVDATQMNDLRLVFNLGINQEKQAIAYIIEEIESDFQNTQAREDIGVDYSNERTKTNKIPGFGLIAAIFALATIGFFIIKQKK